MAPDKDSAAHGHHGTGEIRKKTHTHEMRAFGNDALQERRRHELDAEKREEQMQGLELRQRRREFEEKLRAMHAVELEESNMMPMR